MNTHRLVPRSVALRACLILFAAALGVASLHANPTSPRTMPPTNATFFLSGVQRDLEVAIRSDDPVAIERLMDAGAQVNGRGVHDATPLMVAVDCQSPRAVATLLKRGANPNLKAADGAGAVHLAMESRGAPAGRQILEMIMRGGGDPNTRRPDGDPVIVRLFIDHDLDAVRWFKSIGADIDILSRSDRPVISDEAYAQDWDSVWVLIELGARYDFEQTAYPLSKALKSPYGSSPDGKLYPYKRKVWEFLKEHGIAVGPWVTLQSVKGQPTP